MRSATTLMTIGRPRWRTRCAPGETSGHASSPCRTRAGEIPPGSGAIRGSKSNCSPNCANECGRSYRFARSSPLRALRFRLDPLHVVVGEAEMVADLVNEDVAHQVSQVLAGFAPVVQQRAAVEEDHVDIGDDVGHAFARKVDAAIETEQ